MPTAGFGSTTGSAARLASSSARRASTESISAFHGVDLAKQFGVLGFNATHVFVRRAIRNESDLRAGIGLQPNPLLTQLLERHGCSFLRVALAHGQE